MKSLRVHIIRKLIWDLEKFLFYPKLKRFYIKNSLRKGDVIFDIGANRGQSIEFFSKLYPENQIYAFEPNEFLYEKLVLKYKKNKKISIFNLGVSDINGKKEFHLNLLDETSSFESINLESSHVKKKARFLGVQPNSLITRSLEVDTICLDGFILEYKIDSIGILKIDVEGHELSVLKGLFREEKEKSIKYLQIENHRNDMYKEQYEEIQKILKLNKFSICKVIKHPFGTFEEIIYQRI